MNAAAASTDDGHLKNKDAFIFDKNADTNGGGGDVILVVGACCLDRLVFVSEYPQPDDKIRCTSYCEIGGGNAANTAHCMGLLLQQQQQQQQQQQESKEVVQLDVDDNDRATDNTTNPLNLPFGLRVQLATKLGSDAVAQAIQDELAQAGVDLSSPLFQVAPDATTAFTTIIVANNNDDDGDPTRTCIHTPGSCGELVLDEVRAMSKSQMDKVFENVIHLHCDVRHTDVALFLAQQAKQRNITISLDVEKDRQMKALDQILPLADRIYTNAGQIEAYLGRLEREYEKEQGRRLLSPTATTIVVEETTTTTSSQQSTTTEQKMVGNPDYVAHVLKPSIFLTRWYGGGGGDDEAQQAGREVFITKGRLGSVRICCNSIQKEQQHPDDTTQKHLNRLVLSPQTTTTRSGGVISAVHEYVEEHQQGKKLTTTMVKACYTITFVGISKDYDAIVDTTGAGDAYIGAHIVTQHVSEWDINNNNDTANTTTGGEGMDTRMAFAAWVAGRKLGGPGARRGLPTVLDVTKRLGNNPQQIQDALSQVVGSFTTQPG